MRRVHVTFTAIAALFVVAGCAEYVPHQHMHENWYRRRAPNNVVQTVTKSCDGKQCQRTLHFDGHCEPTDDNGHSLTLINANVGTHICIFNDGNCKLLVRCGKVLFGPSNEAVPIEPGKCVIMVVTGEARNQSFTLEQICTCVEGRSHTNPEVKVGNDEEPGG